MSTDVDQLSREELVDLAEDQQEVIRDLRSQVKEMSARLEAFNRQLKTMKTVIAGDVDAFAELDGFGEGFNLIDRHEILEAQLDGFAERLQEVRPAKEAEKSTETRLAEIRKYLVKQARAENVNIYGADYKEIRALFDGEISGSWASQLMQKAAGTFPEDVEEPMHGFEVADTKPRKKIRVQADKVEDRSLLRLKNSEDRP